MIATFSLLLSLLLVALTAAPADPLAPNEVKGLLDQIRVKRAGAPQVQSDFQEEKTVHLMNKPISSAGNRTWPPPWAMANESVPKTATDNTPPLTSALRRGMKLSQV